VPEAGLMITDLPVTQSFWPVTTTEYVPGVTTLYTLPVNPSCHR
jgi:hypothetical protein